MKLSKINQLYNLYEENPHITNQEAAESLKVSERMIRTMKYRLKCAGYIDPETEDGSVLIVKPFRETPASTANAMKADIYTEMIEAYMEDFRAQTTFADRLAVGREIRLLLEKL